MLCSWKSCSSVRRSWPHPAIVFPLVEPRLRVAWIHPHARIPSTCQVEVRRCNEQRLYVGADSCQGRIPGNFLRYFGQPLPLRPGPQVKNQRGAVSGWLRIRGRRGTTRRHPRPTAAAPDGSIVDSARLANRAPRPRYCRDMTAIWFAVLSPSAPCDVRLSLPARPYARHVPDCFLPKAAEEAPRKRARASGRFKAGNPVIGSGA